MQHKTKSFQDQSILHHIRMDQLWPSERRRARISAGTSYADWPGSFTDVPHCEWHSLVPLHLKDPLSSRRRLPGTRFLFQCNIT